jgi:hypothetical protein
MSLAGRAGAADWDRLDRALAAYRDAHGTPARAWLRDDDAVAPSPALERLLAIAEGAGIPVSLAVIPASAEPALDDALRGRTDVAVLQHGWAHLDHAPPGQKSREFGPDRPLPVMAAEIAKGRRRLESFAGFVPIFVPPWNRIAPALAAELPGLGLPILSGYTNRREPEPIAGPAVLNTHLDPVAWHEGRGLGDTGDLVTRLAARLEKQADGRLPAAGPIGLLTHHLVHDEETFAFLGELLQFLTGRGLTQWLSGAMLLEEFGCGEPSGAI